MDIKAYSTDTELALTLCSCRIWVEDSNDETYTVYAKVLGSFEKKKLRGPFNAGACFIIKGSVDDWKFDQVTCKP
ncbi:hypothetical protein RhiirC2_785258 [Rhizophagus irregularis]|uniref:Uncharacterized protein n=1 Tax=Rhizophagus irregularis TaxID=588596 RepID=A0A2N1MWU3_9GLOM|nr:hypothetical protein RhiirC2_785258 [Rhizophagus irregularis]